MRWCDPRPHRFWFAHGADRQNAGQPDDRRLFSWWRDCFRMCDSAYPPYHATEVSLTFLKDRLVEISLTDTAEPIMLHGVDLFGKQRKVVSQTLFDLEPTPYGKRESGFFPSVGVVVPWPGYWKRYGGSGYIQLLEPTFLLERLDLYCFDPIDAPLP